MTQQSTAIKRVLAVRRRTEALAEPLSAEDLCLQSMDDVSPGKWHLAHTTWFFEQFILVPFCPGYRVFNDAYGFLFNSYYQTVGDMHPRPKRGLLSRPGLQDILNYRQHVNDALARWLEEEGADPEVNRRLHIGLNHEQQHQELMLMDIKHVLFQNPLHPAYRPQVLTPAPARSQGWLRIEEGLQDVGHAGEGFGFDNEFPRHRIYRPSYALADRLVSNGEYLAFMDEGGYSEPALWLMDGFLWAQEHSGGAPLYWFREDGIWKEFTLHGPQALDPHRPVAHLSYFEADAFARWAGARLPTEFEWELAAPECREDCNPAGSGLHPHGADRQGLDHHWYTTLWQWTQSAYAPYPGFKPLPGALGEYNGKFMVNQYVLRGGACISPAGHVRRTYRNFFYPQQRWMFSGLRLAKDN